MGTRQGNMSCRNQRGFSLVEIVVVLSIITIISSMVLVSLSQFRARKILDASVEMVMVVFSQAHLDTISSKDDDVYGVALRSNEAIYFKGAVYPGDSDPSNKRYVFSNVIEIANISLNGAGTIVYFKRFTGGTDQNGTFDVRLKGSTSIKTSVTVSQVGVAAI